MTKSFFFERRICRDSKGRFATPLMSELDKARAIIAELRYKAEQWKRKADAVINCDITNTRLINSLRTENARLKAENEKLLSIMTLRK